MDHIFNTSRALRRRLPIAMVLCLALVFTIMPSIALAGPLGDFTAPVSSSDVEAVYMEAAVIHITAIDPPGELVEPITGVASITYVLDGLAPVVVSGASATVTVPGYGAHTLSFFATDNDGNIEAPINASFEVWDYIPPITVSDREAIYLDSGVITLMATDDIEGDGVAATYYILDGGLETAGTAVTFDTYGAHTLSFWSVDLASNEEVPVLTSFDVWDTIAPITSSDAVAMYDNSFAAINLSATDTKGSGVATTYSILDDGDAVEGTLVTSIVVGAHTLDFWSVDVEGNVEGMKSVAFTVNAGTGTDATAPVSTSDAVATYASSPATIELTTTDEDGGSGIASLSYQVDDDPIVVVPPTPPVGPPPGILVNPITPTVPAPDSHHNSGSDCSDCHTGGCAACHGVGPAPAITTAHPKPASHAFMTVTPCASCHVVNPAATPMTIVQDVVVSGLGAHQIEFWGEDATGNIETPHKMVEFTIGGADVVAPVITVSGVADAGTYTAPVTVTFSALDVVDGVVAATATLDSVAFTSGTTVSALGAHTLVVTATDAADNTAIETIDFTITEAPAEVIVTPVAGANRILTAIEASQLAFADGADYVIVATAYNWPDALGGSALAGALDAPILLTHTAALDAAVLSEIDRLDPTNAIILGGTGAVGPAVETALEAELGAANVERIGGATRYETANAVAAETIDVMGDAWDGTAFVATGANFPDALGASPLAAANGWPIYLANPLSGNNAALVSIMDAEGVTESLILGGPAVVASSVQTQLATLGSLTRLSGADRYATAVAVASYGVSDAGLAWDQLAIATGQDFPDALAGGVLQGKSGSVLLLTHTASLDTIVATTLAANKASITEVRFLGGTGAVSTAVRTAVVNALD